jgi:hypothetical protein
MPVRCERLVVVVEGGLAKGGDLVRVPVAVEVGVVVPDRDLAKVERVVDVASQVARPAPKASARSRAGRQISSQRSARKGWMCQSM